MTPQEVYNWVQIIFDVCLLIAFMRDVPWKN